MEKIHIIRELVENLQPIQFFGSLDRPVLGITYDSRKVNSHYVFVAIAGYHLDGHKFIPEALSKGSNVIVSEKNPYSILSDPQMISEATWLIVPDSRETLALMAERFFRSPSQKLKVIGITGTNGKTTTTYLLESLFTYQRIDVGVIGTINYRWPGATMKARQTTPESSDLQEILARMAFANCKYCFLEVSSHAIKQSRILGCHFEGAIFTNLGRDHLDFHNNLQNYFQTKSRLFTDFPMEWALVNLDDPYGKKIKELRTGKVYSYGVQSDADFRAREVAINNKGLSFILINRHGEVRISSPLLGRHNIYNMLAASACALICGLTLEELNQAFENMALIPGRLEKVNAGQSFNVLIDFAHTPEALERAIKTCRKVTSGKVIVVFGCGGDRDPGKRPLMGEIAAKFSDFAFITSDNPRSEDPQTIVDQIIDQIKGKNHGRWSTILDRREAIYAAIKMAKEEDTVLIAGKGHEQEQIFRDRTVPFSDREIAKEAIISLLNRNASRA